VLGLLAGGMLVIGIALVSFWKILAASEFQAWFASHSLLIGRLMIPLGTGSVVIFAAAVVAHWRSSTTERWCLVIEALAALGLTVTYPMFFAGTKEAFVRGGLS
jgi:hypothetical protein